MRLLILLTVLMPAFLLAESHEWIVKVKPDSTRFLSQYHKAILDPKLKYLGENRWLASDEVDIEMLKLSLGSRLEYVEPNTRFYKTAFPDDPFFNEQWDMHHVQVGLSVQDAWEVTEGLGAVVAVIDTGVLVDHPELSENILPGFDFISDVKSSNDLNGRDADASDSGDFAFAGDCGGAIQSDKPSSWHGTHVAGIVAAKANNSIGVAGVAPSAKVVPVRVLGKCGGSLVDIADAILWAAGLPVVGVPINPNPADVINLSLGGQGSCSFTMQNAIDRATAAGVIVVVAAGNDSIDVKNAMPANCEKVITVAATTIDGGLASYSNFGERIDIAAPGGEILTSLFEGIVNCGNDGLTTPGQHALVALEGTSMAAPHVAGVVALMRSKDPDISYEEVYRKITKRAKLFPATAKNICTITTCGAGIIDASHVLED